MVDVTDFCPKCDTQLVEAPGIGPYCPNPKCNVFDNILGVPEPNLKGISSTVNQPRIKYSYILETPPEISSPGIGPIGINKEKRNGIEISSQNSSMKTLLECLSYNSQLKSNQGEHSYIRDLKIEFID